MKMRILFFIGIILSLSGLGQAPPPVSASQIYQQIEKLKVLGQELDMGTDFDHFSDS